MAATPPEYIGFLYPRRENMAKFKALDRVERIEWDFTGVPALGAQDDDRVSETVQGDHVTGVLPEPDPDTAARFAEAYATLVEDALRARQATVDRYLAAGTDEKPDPAEVGAEVLSTAEAYVASYEQAVAALRIVGVPEDLLVQLPPRYVAAFLSYVEGALTGEGDAA
jgi:hypothetical protein